MFQRSVPTCSCLADWVSGDSSSPEASSFFWLFFKPVSEPWAPAPGCRTRRSQCMCGLVLCTGFLCRARNAQPGCENPLHGFVTHCSALGFHPTCSLYSNLKRKRKKKLNPPCSEQITQTNKRLRHTAAAAPFVENGTHINVMPNLAESGIYFAWAWSHDECISTCWHMMDPR